MFTMNKNKNILITGSSQGIGLSIAKILCENFNVFITGRNENKLKNIINNSKIENFFVADLTKNEEIENLFNNFIKKNGQIDVLINNAGEYVYNPIEKTSDDEISRLIKLNIEAPFKLSKLSVEKMKENKWGRIINIGSISGSVGEAYASLYSMTKSSLIGFSKALALELAEFNITVNTINPGWVDTNLINNQNLQEELSQKEILEMIPQRRFVHPNEVANLCKYLVSEEAKGITGQSINLCAGLSIG